MKKKIFFVSYGGGHSKLLIPVIKKIQETQKYDFEVLGLTASAADYREANIPFYGMTRLMADLGDSNTHELGKKLASDVFHPAVNADESIAYLGLSYAELECEYGAEEAKNLYQKTGRHSFLPIKLMTSWLKKIKPDLVVATSSPRMERAVLEAASALSIPSVCIVDLFCADEYQWVARSNYASKVCVLSNSIKDFLISKGRSSQDIAVTGNPAFQLLTLEESKLERTSVRCLEKIENDFVILWAVCDEPVVHPFTGQPGYQNFNELILRELQNIVGRRSNWRVIIRSHPSMPMKLENLPDRVAMDSRKYPLASILSAVDCVVTAGSTVGLEAAILGVPVISLKMSNIYPSAPYDQHGFAIGIDHLHDLGDALKKVSNGNWAPDSEVSPPQGAVNRVLEVMSALVPA